MSWARGDLVVHREIAWGRPWVAIPEFVVEDTDDLLVTFIAPGARFGYLDGAWPTENGLHPWYPKPHWEGHGVLVVQRPGDAYAVWHFWEGDDRRFATWYLNLQEPFRRSAIGYDTQDHELDIVVKPDGHWFFKDDEMMEARIAQARYTVDEVVSIREVGRQLGDMLDAKTTWWDPAFATWTPDPSWIAPQLPSGWETAPLAIAKS